MPSEKSKPRFLSLLRRTARSAKDSVGSRGADENAVWLAHERASSRARDSSEAAARLASSIAKQRGSVDAAADRMRLVSGRAQELASAAGRVVDGFERLGLVGLNAGLEGARLGENAGRALLLVADEVRAYATRGSETSRELSTALGDLGTELSQLHSQLGQARDASGDVAQEAARTAGATADVEKALGDLSEKLRKSTGSDPETVKAVAEAAEHARALVTALGTLSGKVPRGLLVGALRPVLDPLARLLAEDDDDVGGEGTGGLGPDSSRDSRP